MTSRALIRVVVVVVLALIAGVVTWLLLKDGDDSSQENRSTVVSFEQALRGLASSQTGAVYWVGPQSGVRYEFEQRDDQIYLRYLSGEAEPGTAATLTVGTYPMANAYRNTLDLGDKGWTRLEIGSGGAAAFSNNRLSVFLAFPNSDRQIEVYDPTPGRAAELVQAGRVLPIADGERLGLTLSELRARARAGETIYWTGAEPGVTYEYTRNPAGSVYIRYLPEGAAVGSSDLYPTVGTYPMKDALATTRAAAEQSGAVRVEVGGGATAFYTQARPTSVYVAFPGVDYQIEVYNKDAAEALDAVESGQAEPVG